MSTLHSKRLRKAITWAVVGLYSAAALWFFGVHEPWRDETHAWLIAASSDTFLQLLATVPYEGTPVLWHFLLWLIDLSGGSFVFARVLNFIIALAAVVVFVWKAPMRFVHKLLFPFGYFVLFEFATISRSYALTMVLVFTLAWVWKRRFNRPLLVYSVVALLAHTNFFGAVTAGALLVYLVAELLYAKLYLQKKKPSEKEQKQLKKKVIAKNRLEPSYVVAVAIGLVGLVSVPVLLFPHADVSPHLMGVTAFNADFFTHAFTQAIRIFVPLSSVELHFWNNVWRPSALEILLGTLLLFGSLIVFRLYAVRYRWIFIYLFISLFSIGFLAVKGYQFIRFSGIVFMVWLALLWIGRTESAERGWSPSPRMRQVADWLVGIALVVQVVGIVPPALFDGTAAFSQAPATAEYVVEAGYDSEDVLLASGFTSVGSAVLPYMERDSLFAPEVGINLERVLWDRAYYEGVLYTPKEVVEAVEEEYTRGDYSTAVILFNEHHGSEFMGYRLEAEFTDAIVGVENFYVYTRIQEGEELE